ncbi:hypothetical protein OG203_43450 [Nocardia sp. NBC_01499]|uniref:hypothetical protein n=1 Tax=Nocardia sp. NBC_01499 TaxID=2903597 RepID=UPI0038699B01
MGKHRAPRKPDVPMRLAMVSTAALLTALISADREGPHGGPTPNREHTTSGLASGPYTLPPSNEPEPAPAPPNAAPPFLGDFAPDPEPAAPTLPKHRRDEPAQPVDDPDAPIDHHDVVRGATAAWVSGTEQGYDWLIHLERYIADHMMSAFHQQERTV